MEKLIYILSIIILSSCLNNDEVRMHRNDPNCKIEINATKIVSGNQLSGKITGNNAGNMRLNLEGLFSNSDIKINNGTFLLDSKYTTVAGVYTLSLYDDLRLVDSKKINIIAGDAYDAIPSFLGPKKIPSNNRKESMIVYVPEDKLGNPVADYTPIKLASRIKNRNDNNTKTTKNLLVYELINAQNEMGNLILGAEVELSHSPESVLVIDQSWVNSFSIKIVEHHPVADYSKFVLLKSNVVKDENGNIVPNGTLVSWNIYSSNRLIGSYSSFTINGVAEVYVQNPRAAANWTISASSLGAYSENSISLNFNKAVDGFTLLKNKNGFTIGPVYGALGQLIHDGFPIDLKIKINDRIIKKESVLLNGKYVYTLPKEFVDQDIQLLVEIGGVQKKWNLKWER